MRATLLRRRGHVCRSASSPLSIDNTVLTGSCEVLEDGRGRSAGLRLRCVVLKFGNRMAR